MEQSEKLDLPYIVASQDQKHITHNEALLKLDALVHLSAISRSPTAPPASVAQGDRYLVPTGATGAWAGFDEQIAAWQVDGWDFYVPQIGWRLWLEDEQKLLIWEDDGWTDFLDEIQNSSLVGVNATADSYNRLTVSAPATLLTHEGAGHQLKINKANGADTASLLFQTNWSGRAEMGLAGSDDFQVKVSPDGSDWLEAMRVSASTGAVAFASGLHSGTAIIGDDSFISLDMKQKSGVMMVWCADDEGADSSGGRFAYFFFDCSELNQAVLLQQDNFISVETGNQPIGSSGSDQSLNIRVDVGKIHIENRRGASHRYRWMVMA